MKHSIGVTIQLFVARDSNILIVQGQGDGQVDPKGKVQEIERLTIGDEIENCALLDAGTGDMVVLPPCMKFRFSELQVNPIIDPNAQRRYTLERVL